MPTFQGKLSLSPLVSPWDNKRHEYWRHSSFGDIKVAVYQNVRGILRQKSKVWAID